MILKNVQLLINKYPNEVVRKYPVKQKYELEFEIVLSSQFSENYKVSYVLIGLVSYMKIVKLRILYFLILSHFFIFNSFLM